MNNERLAELREQIDKIDRALVDLLVGRVAIALQIGEAKGASDIFDPSREEEVLKGVEDNNAGRLPSDALRHIFDGGVIPLCRGAQAAARDSR